MLPLQSWLKAPYFWAGTKCYDLLAGSKGFRGSYFLTKAAALEAFPVQKNDELVGAPVYYDGQHNDSRMNISLAMTASLYGATIVNHVEATELPKDSNGKICGAWVRDVLPNISAYNETSDEFVIRAGGVITQPGRMWMQSAGSTNRKRAGSSSRVLVSISSCQLTSAPKSWALSIPALLMGM